MTAPQEKFGDIDFGPKINGALEKAHLTDIRQFLTLSVSDVERLTGLSRNDVSFVRDVIAEKVAQYTPTSALDIWQGKALSCLHQHWKLSTNCEIIDRVLRGGLLSGVITEITGESACGKTQLCLQLCISVQMNGKHSGGAVYICTEDVFPSKRLQQLIHHYSSSGQEQNFGDKIFIEHVADFETLDFCVERKLPALLNRSSIRLVIIDSVTALFRCHYDSTQTIQRAKHLTKFASLFHHLAFQHNIPIVCVNQVSANVSGASCGENTLTPALGLTWANQICCRLMLSRPSGPQQDIQSHLNSWKMKGNSSHCDRSYRRLKIVFAPHIPQTEINICIDESGIHGTQS